MPPLQSYSLRKRLQERGEEPDVYTYDEAPDFLRHQIAVAIHEGVGNYFVRDNPLVHPQPQANQLWHELDRMCMKEVWPYRQSRSPIDTPQQAYLNYIVKEKTNIDDFLSAVEFGCLALHFADYNHEIPGARGARSTGEAAIAEINRRFIEHGVGYQIENLQVLRIDSQIIHGEVVKPALALLNVPMFAKANADFMTAHRHYRAGEYKDCVTAANRAFESTLKAICDVQKWDYGAGDNAAQLVTKVTERGLFTHDFDKSFTAYVAMMKSGLPVVRNQSGGHGEGIAAAAVTPQIARYALNLTAANILFLTETYKAAFDNC
jgi:hypothetical protein